MSLELTHSHNNCCDNPRFRDHVYAMCVEKLNDGSDCTCQIQIRPIARQPSRDLPSASPTGIVNHIKPNLRMSKVESAGEDSRNRFPSSVQNNV